MKKTLMIVLASIVVLAMMAGCGNKNDSDSIDISVGESDSGRMSTDGAEGWPAADLPQGFPAYPNGKVTNVEGKYNEIINADNISEAIVGLTIEISGTENATYEAYLKTLESDGWTASSLENSAVIYMEKGSLALWIGFDEPGDLTM